jgi:hypothetical protein
MVNEMYAIGANGQRYQANKDGTYTVINLENGDYKGTSKEEFNEALQFDNTHVGSIPNDVFKERRERFVENGRFPDTPRIPPPPPPPPPSAGATRRDSPKSQ